MKYFSLKEKIYLLDYFFMVFERKLIFYKC